MKFLEWLTKILSGPSLCRSPSVNEGRLLRRKIDPKEWIFIPMSTSIKGKAATLEQLPVENMVAVNMADDKIYRNVHGRVVCYVPEKEL